MENHKTKLRYKKERNGTYTFYWDDYSDDNTYIGNKISAYWSIDELKNIEEYKDGQKIKEMIETEFADVEGFILFNEINGGYDL